MTPTQMRSLASDLDAVDMALPKTSGHGVHIMFGADALRAAADEVDRLRAVIENAPHQLDCSSETHAGHCDCWKADAL